MRAGKACSCSGCAAAAGGRDMLFVLSVGGGDLERNVSPNLVRALQYAKQVGAGICGVVGRDGGYTARVADACVVVPTVNSATITPHAESFQAVVAPCWCRTRRCVQLR
ncbi:MAG: hypothetical protein U0Z44_12915 [Kouleothrix sp.]